MAKAVTLASLAFGMSEVRWIAHGLLASIPPAGPQSSAAYRLPRGGYMEPCAGGLQAVLGRAQQLPELCWRQTNGAVRCTGAPQELPRH